MGLYKWKISFSSQEMSLRDYSPRLCRRWRWHPTPAVCEGDPDVHDAACCAHSWGMGGAYSFSSSVTVAVTLKRKTREWALVQKLSYVFAIATEKSKTSKGNRNIVSGLERSSVQVLWRRQKQSARSASTVAHLWSAGHTSGAPSPNGRGDVSTGGANLARD